MLNYDLIAHWHEHVLDSLTELDCCIMNVVLFRHSDY